MISENTNGGHLVQVKKIMLMVLLLGIIVFQLMMLCLMQSQHWAMIDNLPKNVYKQTDIMKQQLHTIYYSKSM